MTVNVLIAEDEYQVREGMSEFIRDLGPPYHLIGCAANGLEAINLFEMQQPDVLLTDIRMPIMDGFELIKRVSADYPATNIIIVSGYDDFEYARTAMRYGVKEYILKPLNKEELVSSLLTTAKSMYINIDKFKEIMINKEKWDLRLSELESNLFDYVELGAVKQVEQMAPLFLEAIMNKVNRDIMRQIPFILDSLITLRKRMASIEFTGALIESRWRSLANILSPTVGQELLITETLTFYIFCAQVVKDCRKLACPDVLLRCKEMLETQYMHDLSLLYMADLLGVSAAYLSRMFKKEFGTNFIDYLNHIRLEKAKQLLDTPFFRIKDIAIMTGYRNTYYFNRLFKRYTGHTPQEYRNREGQF
jgi:two-component system response regulator YesN